MFNPISTFFGWKRKVGKLRKNWDRTREKTLKKDAMLRARLLPREDQIEQNLRILEERKLNRGERARLAKEVELDIEEVKALLDSKPEELKAAESNAPYQEKQKEQWQPY